MERVYGTKIPVFAKQINYFSVIEQQDIFWKNIIIEKKERENFHFKYNRYY